MAQRDATRRIARHTAVVSKYRPTEIHPTIDDDELPLPSKTDALSMFIVSQDTLRGSKITHELTVGWNDRPPLFPDARSQTSNRTLRDMARRGPVPPGLRCAVWLTSIVSECNPHETKSYAERFGTLGKVHSLEHSYGLSLKETFPDESDAEDAEPPLFGIDGDQMESLLNEAHGGSAIPEMGVRSLTKVLSTVQHVLGVDYGPLLPDVATLLLNYMPEAHAYASIREMVHESVRYVPISREDHFAHCKMFADLVRKLYPATAGEMERCGALSPDGLDPIFRRFFVPILRYEHVLRLMDMFAIEGMKILLRVASALIQLVEEKFYFGNIKDTDMFWNGVREFVRSEDFDFDKLLKKTFRLHGSTGVGRGRLLRRRMFPNRRTIARTVRFNQSWAEENADSMARPETSPAKPIGLVRGELELELARPAPVRSCLARWLPPIYQNCKLDLIYSTNIHGRSLSQFYDKACRTKRTVTLLEVLGTGSVVGMFANQAWRSTPLVYGDGECFLFRCTPDPKCFKWKPKAPGSIDDDAENEALMEQFMVSRDTFLSMGGNKDGSSGLRLNEDLTRGESSPALGFDNEPLAGEESEDFEVGLVEVYRLVREVDGKAVGGEDEDDVWNFDG